MYSGKIINEQIHISNKRLIRLLLLIKYIVEAENRF